MPGVGLTRLRTSCPRLRHRRGRRPRSLRPAVGAGAHGRAGSAARGGPARCGVRLDRGRRARRSRLPDGRPISSWCRDGRLPRALGGPGPGAGAAARRPRPGPVRAAGRSESWSRSDPFRRLVVPMPGVPATPSDRARCRDPVVPEPVTSPVRPSGAVTEPVAEAAAADAGPLAAPARARTSRSDRAAPAARSSSPGRAPAGSTSRSMRRPAATVAQHDIAQHDRATDPRSGQGAGDRESVTPNPCAASRSAGLRASGSPPWPADAPAALATTAATRPPRPVPCATARRPPVSCSATQQLLTEHVVPALIRAGLVSPDGADDVRSAPTLEPGDVRETVGSARVPEVHVHIGRVEVHQAPTPNQPRAPRPLRPPAPGHGCPRSTTTPTSTPCRRRSATEVRDEQHPGHRRRHLDPAPRARAGARRHPAGSRRVGHRDHPASVAAGRRRRRRAAQGDQPVPVPGDPEPRLEPDRPADPQLHGLAGPPPGRCARPALPGQLHR